MCTFFILLIICFGCLYFCLFQRPEVYARVHLERYLQIYGITTHEQISTKQYVKQRLIELGHGHYLQGYKWDGGSNAWASHLPTDAQVTYICTYLYVSFIFEIDFVCFLFLCIDCVVCLFNIYE
jgi:hypothetical protein